LAAAAALAAPDAFRPLEPLIPYLLGVVMLGMGLTLRPADFARVVQRPQEAAVILVAQWLAMPLIAWGLIRGLSLPPGLAAGVVLVGAAPGGTASNVITALARGDVALSVTVTAVATLLAPVIMPAWVLLILGESIQVGYLALFRSIALIVLLPVVVGTGLRVMLDRWGWTGDRDPACYTPALSALVIAVIVAVVVALNRDGIVGAALPVAAAVVLHNGLGLLAGLGAAWLLRLPAAQRRTAAFEVGMQNSGLAVALAVAHFGPEAALAGALFSVWHNITGSALVSYLRRG
jgi:BASS family bile acid:Na+ symporter